MKLFLLPAIAVSFFSLGVLGRPYVSEVLYLRDEIFISPRAAQFDGLSGPYDVVLLGDSLTDHGRWSELMSVRVANRGIGRDTVSMVTARVEGLPDAPTFILVGINDLLLGHPVSQVVGDYEQLLDALDDRKVVIQSVVGPTGHNLTELNKELSQIARSRGLLFMDLRQALGHPLEHTYDGVHLNGDGYRIWAEQIVEALESMNSI